MRNLLIFLVFPLANCITLETVYLQDEDGNVVQCGPYRDFAGAARQANLRNCVNDYQLAGYERIPEPR